MPLATLPDAAAALPALEARHALREVTLRGARLTWREAGRGPALVLLHGIGSGALAWAAQLDAFAPTHRVLAWDAPGYGDSAPLSQARPLAADYAAVLAQWLAALSIERCTLVGHSLGALVAAAFAARADDADADADAAPPTHATPRREPLVSAVVLACPALGYGDAAPDVRAAKWRERVELIERLGASGLAAERAARLCSPVAAPAHVELVRWNMARVTPLGYAQAAHMLAHEQLRRHARRIAAPLAIVCAELDTVTPASAAQALAHELGVPCHRLAGAAHACYVEHAARFNDTLGALLGAPGSATP